MFNIVSEETYQDGDVIIREGDSGDWVYVILSGKVEISKTVGGNEFILGLLQPGEIFGELAFLTGISSSEGFKRTATARAVGVTTVGVIDREFLDREFNKIHSDFRMILTTIVERFRKMLGRASDFSSRKETRILQTLSLTYKDKKSFAKAYTGNLSNGGLFIITENPFQQGEQFLLKLQLPGLSDSVKVKCEVVWTRKKSETPETSPPGMGVKFIDITKKNHLMLEQYLKEIAKDEEKL
ncbi:MAG: TIGR02266 family protein [Thermodesulfobacteriota bacterium]